MQQWSVRLFVTLLTVLICAGFQTVVWPFFFGSLTAPPLWLIVLLWLCFFVDSKSSILIIYVLAPFIVAFSAMPYKMYFLSLVVTYFAIRFVRTRVFWPGLGYFILASTFFVFYYHVAYVLISRWVERNPSSILESFRIIEILLTPAFAALVFHWMRGLDNLIVQWTGSETGVENE